MALAKGFMVATEFLKREETGRDFGAIEQCVSDTSTGSTAPTWEFSGPNSMTFSGFPPSCIDAVHEWNRNPLVERFNRGLGTVDVRNNDTLVVSNVPTEDIYSFYAFVGKNSSSSEMSS